MESGIKIESVTHAYGPLTVVRDADLHVARGAIHCLLGPSGSGKTTLLRLVAGLERVQQGSISLDGVRVSGPRTHLPPERRSIGYVFQDYALFPHLNVRDNIRFAIGRMPKAARAARTADLLEHVGMADFALAMPHTLSGGQQQRVALVRAMARNPQVMLLDEPFSGLDARLRGEVREVTRRVLKEAATTTLMVTHDPSEAMAVADAISVIIDGRIMQTGPPSELYLRPATREVAELFGDVNYFLGQVAQGQVDTPCGPVPADDCAERQQVAVLIRPESLQVQGAAVPGRPARVQSVRLMGPHAVVEATTAAGESVRATVARGQQLQSGSEVTLAVSHGEAIVLPLNGRN